MVEVQGMYDVSLYPFISCIVVHCHMHDGWGWVGGGGGRRGVRGSIGREGGGQYRHEWWRENRSRRIYISVQQPLVEMGGGWAE